jgi:oligopeptide transport system substrate-binding protein
MAPRLGLAARWLDTASLTTHLENQATFLVCCLQATGPAKQKIRQVLQTLNTHRKSEKQSMKITKLILLSVLFSQGLFAATLHRGLGPEPDSLDIHLAQGLPAIQVLRETREGLTSFDAAGNIVAGVAASWQVLDEGLTYRFELRKNARWSNGDPVTSGDFIRAWRRALSPDTLARTASLLAPVVNAREATSGSVGPDAVGIRALSAASLEIKLHIATPWFLEILAHPVSYPLHEDGVGEPLEAPSNGAFMIDSVTMNAMIRLKKNPYFHSADEVALDFVEYLPIEDPASELSRFRAGELDITETIPAGRHDWLRTYMRDELQVSPYIGSFWLGLNLGREPFANNSKLRHALSLAVDRKIIARLVVGAGELPAWSIVPPGIEGYSPQVVEASELGQEVREQQAKRLYAEAGYGENRPLQIELRYNTSSQHRKIALAVSSMWRQVLGVRTELVNEEWKVFVNNRRQGVVTQVFRGGWIADYADPSSFLDLFRSDNELNTTFYKNEQFDRLMAQAEVLKGAERMQRLQRAEMQLLTDMPVVPLYFYVSRHLLKPTVTGYEPNIRDIHLSRYMGVKPSGP